MKKSMRKIAFLINKAELKMLEEASLMAGEAGVNEQNVKKENGDGWQFHVELKEIRHSDKWDLKPVILEKIGKAPLQYPPLNEES